MAATSAEKNVTKNVVYREVLLHKRQPPPPQVPVPNTPAIPLEHDHSSDLDYNGVYDNREEQAQSVSASLPSNVTLALIYVSGSECIGRCGQLPSKGARFV